MIKQRAVLVFAVAAVLGWAERGEATSAFARRYDVACHFCHDGYPKLNDMGQRFKERGFRMANEEPFDLGRWVRTVPIAVRAIGTRFLVEDGEDSNFGYIKGITAGNLGTRVTYWLDDGVFIQEGEDTFDHSEPDNAWLRLELVTGGKFYLKGGRFELDLPFTQTRTPHLLSYEIYSTNTGFETDSIDGYHHGAEVGGDLSTDWRWSASVVDGRNPEEQEDIDEEAGKFDGNVFLRLSKRANTARFGAFAYIGRNTLVQSPSVVWEDNLLRVGADFSVWLQRLNLYGVGMYGSNDNSVASESEPDGTGESQDFAGGFLQADWHAGDSLVLTVRGILVDKPESTEGENVTFTSVVPGLQLFIRERLKLSVEYAFQNRDRGGFGAVQAEIVF